MSEPEPFDVLGPGQSLHLTSLQGFTDGTRGGGFHLLDLAYDVRVQLPIEISPTLRIERPTDQQLELINDLAGRFDAYGEVQTYYTHDARFEPGDVVGSGSIHREPLPRERYKFLLLTFDGTGNDAHFFLQAALLVSPALQALFHIRTNKPFGRGERTGWGWDDFRFNRVRMEWWESYKHVPPVLDESVVASYSAAFLARQSIGFSGDTAPHRAIHIFELLPHMPGHVASMFEVLGLFMIIEMLLTHQPDPKDPTDSLNRQVRNKVPFVFERMGRQIDYSAFGDAKPKSVWAALYAYRSAFAHGNKIDFKSPDLRLLKNEGIANAFLSEVTRMLIRFSLDDPKLFEGLKEI